MRITEVGEGEVRRRNVAGTGGDEDDIIEEYEEYNSDEEYYTEDEEYEDEIEEEHAQEPRSLRQRLTNVISSFSPSRISKTLQTTSVSMIQQSKTTAKTAGNLAWIITTSLILVGVPVLFAYDREKNAAAQSGQMLPLDDTQSA